MLKRIRAVERAKRQARSQSSSTITMAKSRPRPRPPRPTNRWGHTGATRKVKSKMQRAMIGHWTTSMRNCERRGHVPMRRFAGAALPVLRAPNAYAASVRYGRGSPALHKNCRGRGEGWIK
eukprot:scaffold9354_cov108-Isochrysis_galbana.AAC.3